MSLDQGQFLIDDALNFRIERHAIFPASCHPRLLNKVVHLLFYTSGAQLGN